MCFMLFYIYWFSLVFMWFVWHLRRKLIGQNSSPIISRSSTLRNNEPAASEPLAPTVSTVMVVSLAVTLWFMSGGAANPHAFHYSFLSSSNPGCHIMHLFPPRYRACMAQCIAVWNCQSRVKGEKQSSTQCSALMIYWEGKACEESLSRPDKD